MNDAVATLSIDAFALLNNIPLVALVLIGEVMSADEPSGILRIILRGCHHISHALVVGYKYPLHVEAKVINPALVVGIQIVLLVIGGDSIDILLSRNRRKLPEGLRLVGVEIEGGVVTQLRSVDAVVVAKFRIEAIAALSRYNLDVDAIGTQLGTCSPVSSVVDVVLQPLARFYLIQIECTSLFGQGIACPGRCLRLC